MFHLYCCFQLSPGNPIYALKLIYLQEPNTCFMKSVLLIRHAKSSWEDSAMADFDRPLNDRGKRDAPAMASHLHRSGNKIDLFVSSPAKRAIKTCKFFAKEYGKPVEDILLVDSLYHAGVQNFLEVIASLDNDCKRVAIFSHNPGITDFVNGLDAEVRIDDMPTCAVYGLKADIKDWKDFERAEKKFFLFEYPAKLL